MAFDITPYINLSPAEVRQFIRDGVIDFPTAGMCRGYAQSNLVILPPQYAADFEEYAKLNPFPCPILEIVKELLTLMTCVKAGISQEIFQDTVFMKTVCLPKN